ncbi:MAG TPA: patatin-like phospholipase family protein [Spirochaetia bacterium]|nr:patatin-like phospholipase family protein [Spirochaetia bacterium]
MVTILSVDGGGIRGLMPVRVLDEIRRRLEASGSRTPLAGLFDLVAGTSAGAIVALGITVTNPAGEPRYTPRDILELYERRGTEIFPVSFRSMLQTAVQAVRFKYAPTGLCRVLSETFGDATLRDAASYLLITSFDTEAMQPHCMKHLPERCEPSDRSNYRMRDAARASSAAPTYFPPARISPIGDPNRQFTLVDGAVFANNPAGLAFVEATKIFPDESEFVVFSLGTGDPQQGYSYGEIRRWGYVEWVNPAKGFPIGAIMSAGQSEAVSHQLRRIGGVRYIRINTPLNGCSPAIDDAGPKNIDCLRRQSDVMISSHDAEIDQICRILVGRSEVTTPKKDNRSRVFS